MISASNRNVSTRQHSPLCANAAIHTNARPLPSSEDKPCVFRLVSQASPRLRLNGRPCRPMRGVRGGDGAMEPEQMCPMSRAHVHPPSSLLFAF